MTEGSGKGAGTGPPRTDEEQRSPSKEVAPKTGEVPATAEERDGIKGNVQEKVEANNKGPIDKAKDKLRGQ